MYIVAYVNTAIAEPCRAGRGGEGSLSYKLAHCEGWQTPLEEVLEFAEGLPLALRNLACVVASKENDLDICKMAITLSTRREEWMPEFEQYLKASQEDGGEKLYGDVSQNLFMSLQLAVEVLSERDRRSLYGLSIFPNDFDRAAADALMRTAQSETDMVVLSSSDSAGYLSASLLCAPPTFLLFS